MGGFKGKGFLIVLRRVLNVSLPAWKIDFLAALQLALGACSTCAVVFFFFGGEGLDKNVTR